LGLAVAWTSDVEGKWSPYWATWEGNSRLWNQIVSWTFPQWSQGGWTAETELEGSSGKITLSLPVGSAMLQQMEAIVLNQTLERETIELKPVAPGKLEGIFTAAEPGTYLIQVIQRRGEQIIASETAGLNVAYSPEYSLLQGGEQRITTWMETVEGSLLASSERVFSGELPRKWNHQDISEWLLMLATLLWPVDIALRRVQIPAHWIEKIRQIVKRRKLSPRVNSSKGLPSYREGNTVYQRNATIEGSPVSDVGKSGEVDKKEGIRNDRMFKERESVGERGETNNEQREDPFKRLLAAKNKKR
jgi:hypothetical protein